MLAPSALQIGCRVLPRLAIPAIWRVATTLALILMMGAGPTANAADYTISIERGSVAVTGGGAVKPDCTHIHENTCEIVITRCDDKLALYRLLDQLLDNTCYPMLMDGTRPGKPTRIGDLCAYAAIFLQCGKTTANAIYDKGVDRYEEWVTR